MWYVIGSKNGFNIIAPANYSLGFVALNISLVSNTNLAPILSPNSQNYLVLSFKQPYVS